MVSKKEIFKIMEKTLSEDFYNIENITSYRIVWMIENIPYSSLRNYFYNKSTGYLNLYRTNSYYNNDEIRYRNLYFN